MQAIPVLGGILILALAQAGTAPKPIYQAAVLLPEAEVRCLPGTGGQIYSTNRLHQNQLVQVVRERPDGWLEILPPPGSFSWINKRQVTSFPNHPDNWVVNADRLDKVPVFVGSDINPGTRGTVVGVQLPSGYQMPRALGRAEVSDHEGTWLPIEAPLGEVRYIRSEAVAKSGTPVASGVSSPALPASRPPNAYTASASPLGFPAPASGISPPATDAERLWQQAQQAERAGNINEAIQLYSQLASQTSGASHDLAMQGLNRAYWLRQSQRNASQPSVPPVQPALVSATPASDTRNGNPGATPAVRLNTPGGTGTVSSFTPQGTAPAVSQSFRPPSANDPPWQAVTAEGYRSSGPGRLQRAGRLVDGKRSYFFQSSQNYPALYCTPNKDLDLEAYLDQNVELIGPAIYRGELRANYMIVVDVKRLP